jgi:uncharacterized cupredoxin-like copper-binding protein
MSGRRELTVRSISTLAAVAAAALVLIPIASARLDRQAAARTATVTVKGGEFFFRLSTKSVAKPEKMTFVFKNVGHVQHDFRINGRQTPLTRPGRTARLVVTFKKKGKYPYKCTVPGHAEAGMKGLFTVR